MKKFVVAYARIPTNYNPTQRLVVEAETEADARVIVRDHVGDNGPGLANYDIQKVELYKPPPAGRIVGAL